MQNLDISILPNIFYGIWADSGVLNSATHITEYWRFRASHGVEEFLESNLHAHHGRQNFRMMGHLADRYLTHLLDDDHDPLHLYV